MRMQMVRHVCASSGEQSTGLWGGEGAMGAVWDPLPILQSTAKHL